MKIMQDDIDFYLNCDVLLLIEEFKKFQNNSIKSYGLCLSYFVSAPSLSWDAMLTIKKVEL